VETHNYVIFHFVYILRNLYISIVFGLYVFYWFVLSRDSFLFFYWFIFFLVFLNL